MMSNSFNKACSSSYFKLARMHDLTGAWLLLLPCLWSLILASSGIFHLLWVPVFIVGAIVMRSAGCIINDIIDIHLDKKIKRTKLRPLANGDLTIRQAIIFCSILSCMGLVILITMGTTSIVLGVIAAVFSIIYPFAKYYVAIPQFMLGITFNFGALIGWSTVHGYVNLPPILLYIGSIFWTLYYDTIYAHQDKIEDKKEGINSMSLTCFGSKKWLKRFYMITIIMWSFTGVLSRVNVLYYASLIVIFYFMRRQLNNLDFNNESECAIAFRFNVKVGLVLLFGSFLGKIHEFV